MMFPLYHPALGVKFFPEGQEIPAGWYRNAIEAERARLYGHPVVPVLLKPAPAKEQSLVERATALGIKVDGRWGEKRLRREVAKRDNSA